MLLITDTLKRDCKGLPRERLKLFDQLLTTISKVKAPCTAVGRVRTTHDQLCILQSVDHAAKGDRLNLKDFGQPALIDALVTLEERQHLPLWASHAYASREFIEAAAKQA